MKKFVLIDSHAVIHRAYHALPPLTTPAGEPAGAVYGFTTILLRILRELKPDYIAAAFDLPGATFRHVAYERYKAQRPETPSDLASQFEKVREVLDAFRIPVFQMSGYEADDIIGTIAEKMKKNKGVETIVVTGDMDALQLVRPGLRVYAMRKGMSDTVIYDTAAVRERYGFLPDHLIDFKGLKGDPSDNIPGVKGIGEKTATDLVVNFGSLEGIYKALKKGTKKIPESVAARLRAGEEDAKFSRELATIHAGVPIDFNLAKTARQNSADTPLVRATFQRFGFASLIKRLAVEQAPRGEQKSLLSASLSGAGPERINTPDEFKKYASGARGHRAGIMVEDNALILATQSAKSVSVRSLDPAALGQKPVRDFFQSREDFFAYDAKSVARLFHAHKAAAPRVAFDLLLAAYLTENFTRDFAYAAIVAREVADASGEGNPFAHFFDAADALERKLAVGRLKHVFTDIEMPVVPILAEMEERGVMVDAAFLSRLAKKVDKELTDITKKIHAMAGEEFNINSSQQLSVILFERLGVSTRGLRKTEKGGVISTRESELEKLKDEHPIIARILDYRELAKLKTTYIDALPKLIDERTGRIHTTFNQTGTSTGRLSSSNPNLQNIPIMSEMGREIRRAFAAPAGFSFVSFDYSQIELRVAAHIADDKKMIAAFQSGMDIHSMTAAEIYNVPLDAVTPELRRAAKTLNFGVLYGMGASALAESTAMSREDAKKFIDEYFHDFSGIAGYIERTKRLVEEQGYVETLFGRRRYIPEINSANWQLRREAERMAVNMPIQGTATGDIVKLAMTKVDERIKKQGWEDDARMLIQVHDELVFEIKKERVKEIAAEIKHVMEHVADLSVPLVVDIKAGPNWGEQEKIL